MAHSLDYKTPPRYAAYRKRANDNFPDEVFITEIEFQEITNQRCVYCGKDAPNGIDRIDNLRGYNKENCVPACKHCNYVKGDLSIEDFNTWKHRFVRKQTELMQ